jgi:hypothetical protein
MAVPRGWRRPCAISQKGTNRGRGKGASETASSASCEPGCGAIVVVRKALGFRFAYDKGMTLAIYARATDGVQDSATATLEETFS